MYVFMPLKLLKYVLKIQNNPLKMHLCSIKINKLLRQLLRNYIEFFT